MKHSYCKLVKCARLMDEEGLPRCNQQGTDGAAYNERIEFVGAERCMELRREARKMQHSERPWQY